MRIQELKIEDFLEEVASKKPTPGGGAVAAVVGALAAGLVEMVCALTRDKQSLPLRGKDIEILRYKAKKARRHFLGLVDEDCAVFDAVIAAYRTKDKLKIKKALLKAIEIPAETKKLSLEVERLARKVARIGNKNAYSDAMSAVYLAQAAAKSAEENIKINKIALVRLS